MREEKELNKYIGKRISERRAKLKMSLKKLGNTVKVSHQQIAKYENGINRVSASTLYEIANILGVSVSYFYPYVDNSGISVNIKNNTIEVKLPENFEIKGKEIDDK